ncbi:cytosine/adenosine deaminase [Clostridium sp. SY8519]|jgi:tRNA(adenine34) deaminase|nr:cytosine/adenosine deaminase [Clostridium sp. SY8519]
MNVPKERVKQNMCMEEHKTQEEPVREELRKKDTGEEEAKKETREEKKEEESQVPAFSRKDIKYMKEAIRQAKKAKDLGEVPIGCVIVYEDRIIGRGYNRRNTDRSTLAHAELAAIRKACKKMGDWRLEGCTMYVTLEPCQMCSGALVQSRISKVVIGTMNPKAGCAGSVLNLLQMKAFNHQVDVEYGLCKEMCAEILRDFFRDLRRKNKEIRLQERKQKEIQSQELG